MVSEPKPRVLPRHQEANRPWMQQELVQRKSEKKTPSKFQQEWILVGNFSHLSLQLILQQKATPLPSYSRWYWAPKKWNPASNNFVTEHLSCCSFPHLLSHSKMFSKIIHKTPSNGKLYPRKVIPSNDNFCYLPFSGDRKIPTEMLAVLRQIGQSRHHLSWGLYASDRPGEEHPRDMASVSP